MSKLSNEEINHIRNSLDIVDVVSEYIPLTKKGKGFFGVCPFHDDSNPSMSVSREKQMYKCFSCGAAGNVINFVMNYEQITFIDTMKVLADKAGITIALDESNYVKKDTTLFEMHELSQKFYINNLNSNYGINAIKYLNERGFDEGIIKEFGVGLSIKERAMLTNLLTKKGFSENDLVKSGLVNKSDNGLNDVFYNRIMFPLYDTVGKVVGYSGRIYDNNDSAKYVNTKETNIFKKGELLYNYHRAKEHCRTSKTVIVLEGFMDVIRLHSVGIKNAVATMGTAVTKKQAALIKRLAQEVLLCFDSDDAGVKATLACSEELINQGIVPKVIKLERGMDPDEFIKAYGSKEFLDRVENAISIMDFKIDYYKKDINLSDSNDLAKYVSTIVTELSKIDDDILKEVTIHKISEESGLEIEFLKSKLNNEEVKEIKRIEIPKTDKYELAEKYLIYYMLKSVDVIKMYRRKVSFIPTYEYRLLALEINEFYTKNKYINVADLFTVLLGNEKLTKLLGDIDGMELKDEFTLDEIDDYINVISEFNLKKEKEKLTEKMKKAVSTADKLRIAEQIRRLNIEE